MSNDAPKSKSKDSAPLRNPKFFQGKPCPDPAKGERCRLCGATWICKAVFEEKPNG